MFGVMQKQKIQKTFLTLGLFLISISIPREIYKAWIVGEKWAIV
jgi:hypothetical protein